MPRFTKDGATIPMDDLVWAVEESQVGTEMLGFCVKCGASTGPVEPDARKYECPTCGEHAVFGAEELMLYVA